MKRKAMAVWEGGIRGGKGKVSTESGALKNAGYGFLGRFKGAAGTNPEELIAAAHASCFAMAFSGKLEGLNMKPANITVKATVHLNKRPMGWTVTEVNLKVTATVPGAKVADFMLAANSAKAGCPISRLLSPTAKVSMEVRLV